MLKNHDLTHFICDYCRIIIIGNARSHEIEALMDEEIQTIRSDKLKSYHAMVAVGDGLPALGIVAAVLGVVKAMGALDQSPEILGGLIGAALVGTFLGIFLSYAVVGPIATKIKTVREKKQPPLHHRQADAARLHERRDCRRSRSSSAARPSRPMSGRRSTPSSARPSAADVNPLPPKLRRSRLGRGRS